MAKLLLPLDFYYFALNGARIRVGRDWAEWPLSAHNFRFLAHFTTLGRLRREMEHSGFEVLATWDTEGTQLDHERENCTADYIHFVCRRLP